MCRILTDSCIRFMFSLFLPPKTVSAVRLYGDEAFFDASASFYLFTMEECQNRPDRKKALGEAKKAQIEKADKSNY